MIFGQNLDAVCMVLICGFALMAIAMIIEGLKWVIECVIEDHQNKIDRIPPKVRKARRNERIVTAFKTTMLIFLIVSLVSIIYLILKKNMVI